MATEKKIIEVEVRESGLDELNHDLDKVQANLKETSVQGDKAAGNLEEVGKNGGAIATLDRLTGGLASQIRDAAEASKVFNISLRATRVALIATGIGVFVVALGLAVAYWDEINDFIAGVNRGLEHQIELQETLLAQHDREIAILNAKKSLLEAEGKSTANIIEQLKQVHLLRISDGEQQITNLQAQLAKEQSVANEYSWYQKIGIWRFGQKTTEQEQADINATNEAIDALIISTTNAKTALANLNNPESTAGGAGAGSATRGADAVQSAVNPITGLTLVETGELFANDIHLLAQYQTEKERIQRESADATIQIAELEKEARLDVLWQSGQALMAFGDLVGQQTGAGKALAAAGALINTFVGITEVWRSPSVLPEPFATAARIASTATVAASGFAAVKNIGKVQVPGVSISNSYFGSGGGGGGTVATPTVQTPDFNIVGESNINQLADVIRESQGGPTRAYVVSGDIRSQDELERTIKSSATIG